jgi:hypothetical protein
LYFIVHFWTRQDKTKKEKTKTNDRTKRRRDKTCNCSQDRTKQNKNKAKTRGDKRENTKKDNTTQHNTCHGSQTGAPESSINVSVNATITIEAANNQQDYNRREKSRRHQDNTTRQPRRDFCLTQQGPVGAVRREIFYFRLCPVIYNIR